MIEIGRDSYIVDEYIVSTEYDEPTLAITVSQMESMNESKTYEWRLISTYTGQVDDLIGDAIFCFERDLEI
jgi:hypothetical protein